MPQKIRYRIEGMTCQACASRIEKVLRKKPFILKANVNYANEEVHICYDRRQTSPEALAALIEKTGYRALDSEAPPVEKHAPTWRLQLLLAIALPFLIGMAGMLIGRHHWMLPPAVQLALASTVQLWLAQPYYRSAWASLKGGMANMDVLVALGTGAIYLYSLSMLFSGQHDHIYFEAGVMVITFVSLGKYLEQRSKKNSLNSLGQLLKLTPRQVQVERDGRWQTLPLDHIQIGDRLRAAAGERIAADGIVDDGSGWTDESHLTGESRPENKNPGSRVLAGALVHDGSITYRAEHLGNKTLLGDMMSALAEAQGSKAPIARIADRAAAIFVPGVVAIAAVTFAITAYLTGEWRHALMRAVAVLVIACPCALGLATPAAIMTGMGKAVRHGIWYKDAAAMEEAARVDTVVLDKTGTLTQGKPQITAVWLAPQNYENNDIPPLYPIHPPQTGEGVCTEKPPPSLGINETRALCEKNTAVSENTATGHTNKVIDTSEPNLPTYLQDKGGAGEANQTQSANENELYRLAAAIEQNANHPLARAIVQAAQTRGLILPEAHNVRNDSGSGISADIDNIGHVKVGKPDYCGLQLPPECADIWHIASIVAVSVNGQPFGAFALADTIRNDSRTAVARLQAHGIAVCIMSGDHADTVTLIARELGIDDARGNLGPRDKAAAITALKAAGKTVAMVGDGINDAPALAAANVSFAMKDGAAIAEHTASATLMQHSVNQLVDALLISRATLKNIRQNLFFAFIYNILGIPLAATGYLNPILASAAMALSSLSVLGNALRLKATKLRGCTGKQS